MYNVAPFQNLNQDCSLGEERPLSKAFFNESLSEVVAREDKCRREDVPVTLQPVGPNQTWSTMASERPAVGHRNDHGGQNMLNQ